MSPLEYVEMKAREADPNVTMEKCRQAVGALGLRDSIALTKVWGRGGVWWGPSVGAPGAARQRCAHNLLRAYACAYAHAHICGTGSVALAM
eukprot:353872-Chlamydomonas_euryale.AAC.1